MCATTKSQSVTWQSSGGDARMTPVSPPNRKVTRNPTDHSIGDSKVRCPRHIVPVQLKNFTPVGIAIRKDLKEKNGSSPWPVANVWCAQAVIDSHVMEIVAPTMPT